MRRSYSSPRRQRGFIINPFVVSAPNLGSLSALLHFEDSDGSTVMTDVTGKTWTAFGDAQIDTAQSKYGTSSLLLDGAGDYISTTSHAGFGFEDGEFTIEGWFRPSSLAAANICLVDTRTGANEGIAVYASAASVGNTFSAFSNAGAIGAGSGVFVVGSWTHFAVVRDGTTVRGYLGGVQQFATVDSRTYASASTCFIGDNYIAPSQPASGWLDEFRITKGFCHYPGGTTFTPPTSAFPDS